MYSKELQIIDYQTQQYRLLPALATSYANLFAVLKFRDIMNKYQKEATNFKDISPQLLAKVQYFNILIEFMLQKQQQKLDFD
jgi:hypothetical protein